jgi:hypothetical protein
MFTRRFVLLAGILVTLNLALWSASPGLALRHAIVQQLFGPRMIRAEVVKKGGQDWRLDRGVIRSVTTTQLTLKEADGRVQQIPLSPTTKVIGLGGHRVPAAALLPRWHVLVTWPANGAAESVDIERVPRGRSRIGPPPSAAPASSLS